MRLRRVIHLLQHESSILAKIVLPADTQKKKITNCGTALDYLTHAGVSLDDGDGMVIVGEDIAGGDKELILTLLWNMFVHLQELPNKESIVSMQDVTDAVHNFVLSQKLATIMGNFPEVLQLCEILEYNGACNERSVIILLVFLCSQLLVKTRKDQLNFHKLMGCSCLNPDRKWRTLTSETECNKEREQSDNDAAKNFKAVQAWWQEMAKQNSTNNRGTVAVLPFSANKCSSKICKVSYQTVIDRKKYLEMKQAISSLQLYIKSWLVLKKTVECRKISASIIQEKCEPVDVKQKTAAILIQKAARTWISQRCQKRELVQTDEICTNKCRQMANACSAKPEDDSRIKAAVKIQSHFHGWVLRRQFQRQIQAALDIQTIIRSQRSLKYFGGHQICYGYSVACPWLACPQ